MRIVFKLAFRNIHRNIRRTLISMTAIGCGLAALLFHQSFVIGFQVSFVENSVRIHSGHIQIHKEGYQRQKKLELKIDEPEAVSELLDKTEGVEAYSQRVNFRGLVSSAENSGGVLAFGIEPENEMNVTRIFQKMKAGRYLSTGDDTSILIGTTLAEDLAVGLGDKVVIMTQAVDGSIGAELFRVRGLFETGNPQFDEGVVYVTKKAAQGLLEMGEAVTEFAIITEDRESVESAMGRLSAQPATRGLEVLSWKEISPHLVQLIDLQSSGLLIILAIVFFIVSIGVINTMLMSVMERIREFGVMLSLGTRPYLIVSLIITEAFYLGIMGLVFGSVLGFSAVYYFHVHGIDLSSYSEAMATLAPGEAVIYPMVSLKYTAISALAVMVTSLFASLYPAFKAARLTPVAAMRHV